MSGDFFWPPDPALGDNFIGSYSIGITQIGTVQPWKWQVTVISQYANSDTLCQIIADCNSWLDQTYNFEQFYSLIWNIDTAQGYGLDVWGRILGLPRNILVDQAIPYFAFDIEGQGFDQGQIYNEGDPRFETVNTSLNDNDYRRLLLAKAAANISSGTTASIMTLLNSYYSAFNEQIFINETNESSPLRFFICQVGKPITLTNLAILENNYLPAFPAGISTDVLVVSQQGPMFGFDLDNDYVAGFDKGVIDMTPFNYRIFFGYGLIA